MKGILENDNIKIAVNPIGAELSSLVIKKTGRECIWQADPSVWLGHAPLLFPHCGSLKGDLLRAKGGKFPAPRHGFARFEEFELLGIKNGTISYALKASEKTMGLYPFDFTLKVEYTLENDFVLQKVSVFNPKTSKDLLPFSIGFHPAFSLPFNARDTTDDYILEFERPETPLVVATPNGLVNGQTDVLFENKKQIQLNDDIFANDSICMSGLKSRFISLKNKKTGAHITVGIEGFPYVLIWGPSKGPLGFICIEPWLSLPDKADAEGDFYQKDDIETIKQGEVFSCTLSMQFVI